MSTNPDDLPKTLSARDEKRAVLKQRFDRAAGLRDWQERFARAAREARDDRNHLHAARVADFLAMLKERDPEDIPKRLWPSVAARAAASGDFDALRLASRHCDVPAIRLREEDLTALETADGKAVLGFDLLNYLAVERPPREGALKTAPFLAAAFSELLSLGCDARLRAPDGQTPLDRLHIVHRAALGALIPCSDLDSRDAAGLTVLMRAALHGPSSPNLVQELLNAGARPDEPDASGSTALMMAVARRHGDWAPLVPVSNLSAANHDNLTVVDLAFKSNNLQALDALCLAVDSAQSEAIAQRLLLTLLPQSSARRRAISEARALREQLRGQPATADGVGGAIDSANAFGETGAEPQSAGELLAARRPASRL